MKILKRSAVVFLFMLLLFSAFAFVSGRTYLFKAVWHNFADIDDYKIFTNNSVAIGDGQPWKISAQYNKPALPENLKSLLDNLGTIAVVIIKNDSLLFEEYWDGYNDSSFSGSFSMAKSITSLLIGAAIKEGKIKSLDEPIGNYLPEFKEGKKGSVKIVDLLTMSSGSDWNESYANPLSVTTELYYGDDVYKTATGVHIIKKPGTIHSYKSGDSQLLGLILEKATGKSLSDYASEKLWKPLGAEHIALWSTDHLGGNEKAYCCFNTNARDFARLGQLMLDSGSWKGNEIISKEYFQRSVTPCMLTDEHGEACNYYGLQWWLVPYQPGVFYARGILGQYIIVIPSKNEVIVRLGKHRSANKIQTVPEETDELIKWGMSL
jgi:CubicO group peptidase (beta-lactamase class C family)